MSEPPAPTPHDALFRHSMSSDDNVRSLIRLMLPADAVAGMDLSAMRREEGTFVDETLRGRQTDLLVSVPTGRTDDAARVWIYVLADHKSDVDRMMARQLFTYVDRIWQRVGTTVVDGRRVLPPVVPIVLYHGRRRWTAPRDIGDLVATVDGLEAFRPSLPIHVWDVWNDPEPDWRPEDDRLRGFVGWLKYGRTPELPSRMPELLRRTLRGTDSATFVLLFKTLRRYAVTVNQGMTLEEIDDLVDRMYPMTPLPGSTADKIGKRNSINEFEQLLGEPKTPTETLEKLDFNELRRTLDDLRRRVAERMSGGSGGQ